MTRRDLLHLQQTFAENERLYPDLMEPYCILLADDSLSAADRARIMWRGLRETIARRHPMPEAREVAAVQPDPQQGLGL